jgi:hypothetical protein
VVRSHACRILTETRVDVAFPFYRSDDTATMNNFTPTQIMFAVVVIALLAFCGCCGGCWGCRGGEERPAEKPVVDTPKLSRPTVDELFEEQLKRESLGKGPVDLQTEDVTGAATELRMIERGREAIEASGEIGWINPRTFKAGEVGKLRRVTVGKVTNSFLIVIANGADTRGAKSVMYSLRNVDIEGMVDGQEVELSADGSVFYACGTEDFSHADGGSRRLLVLMRIPPR